MKKILFILTVLFAIGTLTAQDKIYFKDGKTLDAKIIVVSESKIEYKKSDNLTGPIFEIGLSNINMIVYENGDHQMFNQDSTPKKNGATKFSRTNRINLDLLAVGENGPTSISYEILNEDGSRGIEIPINVYFNSDGVVGYTLGVNYKYYLAKEGKGFYVGPAIGLGVFDWYTYDYYYGESTDFSAYVGAKLGGQFQISDLFGINLAGNVGAISNFDEIDFGYSLNLGINFSF